MILYAADVEVTVSERHDKAFFAHARRFETRWEVLCIDYPRVITSDLKRLIKSFEEIIFTCYRDRRCNTMIDVAQVDELSAKDVENPDERAEALINPVSPLSYLTAENTIPTVSAYGGKDPLVGTGHCAALRERFKELGAKEFDESDPSDASTPVFDCLEYPHSGHMLESDPDYARRFHELVLKYAQRYLDEPAAKESAAQ